MNKIVSFLLAICILFSFSGCSDNSSSSKPETLDLSDKNIVPLSSEDLTNDERYFCGNRDLLYSYYEKTKDDFLSVCKYYTEEGYDLYSYNEINGNLFATYTYEERMLHIYWIECEEELNIVFSANNGGNLPPKNPEITSGNYKTTITQLHSKEINEMGYVIQLADGSFIIYDGGYANQADQLWETLTELKGSEADIVIRAWLITHAHGDHYPCFAAFGHKYGDKVTLETLLINPIGNKTGAIEDTYLNKAVLNDVKLFEGAKVCYVHTGMMLNFCNVQMEILFTHEELYIADASTNLNNTSIVSRIYNGDYTCLMLADAGEPVGERMVIYYGDELKSDMCQVAHHGVEDFPLIAYRHIKPSILWYPCNSTLYNENARDVEVRKALKNSKHTKEIILYDEARQTRELVATKD